MSEPAAGSAVTIGVFDGLHLGHRALIDRTLAAARDGRTVAVSFDPHPDVVLARDGFRVLAPLTPLQDKRRRLRAMGIDTFAVVPFTRELAALSPEEFVDRFLVAPHALHTLVVGEGFALGKGRAGDLPRLRAIGAERGFAVESVPLVTVDGAAVSSTRIRALLAEGRVADAARQLGRGYSLTGVVVTGDGRGRTIGFPTANLRLLEEQLLPADGVYATRARLEGEAEWRPAATGLGVRPTFDGTVRTIEAHLLDWSGELVGRVLELEFVAWIRAELRFDGVPDLVAAMDRDVAETRRVLAG